jgi:hypothetical protein
MFVIYPEHTMFVICPEHDVGNEMTKITHSIIGNTNQRMGVHGPLNISEVGSGAVEE